MSDENKNKKLIDDLKNLPKVDVPKNFETELWRKINSSEEAKKESIWDKLFSPGKLAPAAVALATVVIIFFIVDGNSEVMEDPLNIEPRLREDVIVAETMDEVNPQVETKGRYKEEKSDQKIIEQKSSQRNVQTESFESFDQKETEMPASNQGLIAKDTDESTIDSNSSDQKLGFEYDFIPPSANSSSQEISRNSLNFMKRSLSTKEQQEVKQLKMKVTNKKNDENEQNSNKTQ